LERLQLGGQTVVGLLAEKRCAVGVGLRHGRDLLGRPKPSAGPSLLPLRAKPAARIVVHGVGRDAHLRAGPRRAGKREGGQAARLRPTLPLGAGPRQGGPGGSRARPAPRWWAATWSRAVAPGGQR